MWLEHWERLGWRGIKGWLHRKMIDLQEVFCSPACLSEVVFTSALIGSCLSSTGVPLCVCAAFCTFTLYPFSTGHTQNLYHDLFPEAEKILKVIWVEWLWIISESFYEKPYHDQKYARFWPVLHYWCTYACPQPVGFVIMCVFGYVHVKACKDVHTFSSIPMCVFVCVCVV